MNNYSLRGLDETQDSVFHILKPTLLDIWYGVDFERTHGICIYTREALITRIADLIATGRVAVIETPNGPWHIDHLHNSWGEIPGLKDRQYLTPAQYLPIIVANDETEH